MQKKDIPVLLLTGYLGSGKTTLVNHILANEKGIKFAVIVNDIGEVNIDADLIQKGGVVGKKDDSLLTSSMRHPKQKFYLGGSKSDLIARCFSVRKSVFVK